MTKRNSRITCLAALIHRQFLELLEPDLDDAGRRMIEERLSQTGARLAMFTDDEDDEVDGDEHSLVTASLRLANAMLKLRDVDAFPALAGPIHEAILSAAGRLYGSLEGRLFIDDWSACRDRYLARGLVFTDFRDLLNHTKGCWAVKPQKQLIPAGAAGIAFEATRTKC